MEKDSTDISIPTALCKEIEKKLKDSDIASIQEYVIRILEESLSKSQEKGEDLSKEEENKVKERLKALGYMD
jgi:hypothetical protein